MVRTLVVTHSPIWPVRSGSGIRRSTTIASLQRHGPVTLLQIPLGPTEPRESSEAPIPVRVHPIGPRSRRPGAVGADLLGDQLPTELVGYSWRRVASALAGAIDTSGFDLVWACRAPGFLATRQLALPTVCDLDDLEDVKLRRLAAVAPSRGLEAARVRWRVAAWARLQDRCAARSEVAVVCTDDDADRLARRHPTSAVAVVPNCFPRPSATGPAEATGSGELLLLGLHTYGPNADAAAWFVGSVLPLVRAAHPDVVVRIVGEAGDRIHRLAGDGVVVTGAVPDPGQAFSRAAALVVPLRYGSGSRLKIIEAWARGVPVVTTTVGAEGLGATDGVDVLVGDDPAGLAAACGRLLVDRGCGDALLAGGRRRYEEGHTEEVLDRHVDAVLDRALAGDRAAR